MLGRAFYDNKKDIYFYVHKINDQKKNQNKIILKVNKELIKKCLYDLITLVTINND
jgi:hypothetical protein